MAGMPRAGEREQGLRETGISLPVAAAYGFVQSHGSTAREAAARTTELVPCAISTRWTEPADGVIVAS